MKKKPPLKFNMIIRAFAIYPKNNRITFELPNFLSPTQNHNHLLVNQKSMIRLISFSTSTAIGIEGYPREAEGEDNVVYARSLYEQGKLKDAIDHLYRLKQPGNLQVTRDTAMGRTP